MSDESDYKSRHDVALLVDKPQEQNLSDSESTTLMKISINLQESMNT